MQKEKNDDKKELIVRILFEEGKILIPVFFLILIHGLIHLLGFVAYWQFVEDIEDLTYKTTLFFEMLDVGDVGIRIFGVIWLFTAIGYIIVVVALVTGKNCRIRESLAIVTIISLIITLLDFTVAYTGTLFNVIILTGLILENMKNKENKSKIRSKN
jgi:hypothetical protein